VEFVTASGRTQALVTLAISSIRPVSPKDILAVRQLDAARAGWCTHLEWHGRYRQRGLLGRDGSDGPLCVRRELSGERVRIFDRGRLQFDHRDGLVRRELTNSPAQIGPPFRERHADPIAIVTHPKIYKTPTPLERALEALAELNACATLEFIREAGGYLDSLAGTALAARVQGGAIHDARRCSFSSNRTDLRSSSGIPTSSAYAALDEHSRGRRQIAI
jgi:hypothetical protein